jgi:hypothetical protein
MIEIIMRELIEKSVVFDLSAQSMTHQTRADILQKPHVKPKYRKNSFMISTPLLIGSDLTSLNCQIE